MPVMTVCSSCGVNRPVVTDWRGKPTTYTFNPAGYTTSITDHLGQVTTITRDPAGSNLVTEILDPLNRTTRFGYDTNPNTKNLISITRYKTPPMGDPVTWQFTYDTAANHYNLLTSVTTPPSPVLRTWTYGLDAAGKTVTSITDPLTHVTNITYNGNGQPMTITTHSAPAASQTTTFDYDLTTGFLTSVTTSPDGSTNLTTTYTYDQLGRRVRVTDPRGARTRFSYDLLNRLIAVTDPLGRAVQFQYDPNSNLTKVIDPRTGETTYAYDNMDRLQTRTDPLNKIETYGYDVGGHVTSFTDRKNQQTTWDTYDDLNRPTVVRFHNSIGTEVATLTYGFDAVSRLRTLTDPSGTITWDLDALNRLTTETTQGNNVVTYGLDDANRRTSMLVSGPGQTPVVYTLDNADRLTDITRDTLAAHYGYDNANRRTSLTLPNNVTIGYGYDDANRLTGLNYSGLVGGDQSLTYAYDLAGNRTILGGSWARTLLPDVINSASYDAANRQLSLGGKSMTYDFNGNLETLADGGLTTYTWDVRDRLAGVTGPGLTASFAYDPIGRRSQKTINPQTTMFQYDGADIIREVVGATPADYLRGLSIDEPLDRIESAGKAHYLPDALGSSLALSDDGGNVTTSYTYGPFGQTQTSGAPSPNVLQYTGRENDGTGLYYYRARLYSPQLNRFLSEDPNGQLLTTTNLYAYVDNNPITFIDPLGLDKGRSGGDLIVKPRSSPDLCGAGGQRGRSWFYPYPIPNPDYVVGTLNLPLPWFPAVGVSLKGTVDQNGRVYFAPGLQAGIPPRVSGSVAGGYLPTAGRTPTSRELESFNTRLTFGAAVGAVAGLGFTWSPWAEPGKTVALEPGIYSPQAGVGANYAWLVAKTNLCW